MKRFQKPGVLKQTSPTQETAHRWHHDSGEGFEKSMNTHTDIRVHTHTHYLFSQSTFGFDNQRKNSSKTQSSVSKDCRTLLKHKKRIQR